MVRDEGVSDTATNRKKIGYFWTVHRCFCSVSEYCQIKNVLVTPCYHSYDVAIVILLVWNLAVLIASMVKCYVCNRKVNC